MLCDEFTRVSSLANVHGGCVVTIRSYGLVVVSFRFEHLPGGDNAPSALTGRWGDVVIVFVFS